MKSLTLEIAICKSGSLPVRGAWIEIDTTATMETLNQLSLPVRGAWIEMLISGVWSTNPLVAPRAGSVD